MIHQNLGGLDPPLACDSPDRKYVARKRGQIKVTGWVLFIIFYVVVGLLFSALMYSVSHLYAAKLLSK